MLSNKVFSIHFLTYFLKILQIIKDLIFSLCFRKGVDFRVKQLCVDGHPVVLQLWDTAGQERYRSITKQYFRKADGVLVMFDIMNESSFINIRNWMESVKDGADESAVIVLVGNKLDLAESDETKIIKYKEGSRVADVRLFNNFAKIHALNIAYFRNMKLCSMRQALNLGKVSMIHFWEWQGS